MKRLDLLCCLSVLIAPFIGMGAFEFQRGTLQERIMMIQALIGIIVMCICFAAACMIRRQYKSAEPVYRDRDEAEKILRAARRALKATIGSDGLFQLGNAFGAGTAYAYMSTSDQGEIEMAKAQSASIRAHPVGNNVEVAIGQIESYFQKRSEAENDPRIACSPYDA